MSQVHEPGKQKGERPDPARLDTLASVFYFHGEGGETEAPVYSTSVHAESDMEIQLLYQWSKGTFQLLLSSCIYIFRGNGIIGCVCTGG